MGAVLIWAGHSLLFSRFMLYDDEGYVLISLRNFSLGGALYDQVYSQYGPAFYQIYNVLHQVLGFAWDNTTGRLITLVNWTGTAFFCALLVRRAGGSWPVVIFTLADVFIYLWIMINEPMHPGSTITVLVAAVAWLGWEALQTGRMTGFAILLGVFGATLALTKINVGVFFIVSAGFWLLASNPAFQARAPRLALAGLGLVLPWALMRGLAAEAWVQTFALLAGGAIFTTTLAVGPVVQTRKTNARTFGWFVLAGVVVSLLFAIGLLLHGTSLRGLWEGVIIAPLKHPGVYSFPMRWRPGVLIVGALSLALVVAAARRPDDRRLALIIAWSRVATLAFFQLTLLPQLATSQAAVGLSYGLPLAGLFAWPLQRPQGASIGPALARSWLAVLLVLQSLHAYPIAGSQLNWGTFLWVPLMVLGFKESLTFLMPDSGATVSRWVRRCSHVTFLAIAGYIAFTLVQIARTDRHDHHPLGLTGAESIGLPASVSSALQIIAENARVHGDVLCTLPGLYSLNLWTGLDTPTLDNATHWFSLLSPERQQAIIDRLTNSPKSILVVQQYLLDGLRSHGFRPDGPLFAYLHNNYRRSFSMEGYSFWIRNERSIAPLSIATLSYDSAAREQAHRFTITMATRPGRISKIAVRSITHSPRLLFTLDARNASVLLAPLDLSGSVIGEEHAPEWPVSLSALSRLTVRFDAPEGFPPPEVLELLLLGEDGRPVGAARVLSAGAGELPPAAQR